MGESFTGQDPFDPDIDLQRTTDNFNLDTGVLPLSALETAHYRPTGVTDLTYDQVRDPAYLEIMVALEKKYQIKIPEKDLLRITCLNNVYEIVKEKRG